MKNQTQTTNQGKRNFFQKMMVVLAILVFTGMGFTAKAQWIQIDVVNAVPGCTNISFDAVDSANNSYAFVTSTNAFNTSGCVLLPPGVRLDHIVVTNCGLPFNYGGGGVFTSGTVKATGCPCGNSNITATVVSGGTLPLCSPTTGLHITFSIN
jgi:hypothetical protein